jgi:hypothetical protein
VNDFVSAVLRSRISRRALVSQHLELRKQRDGNAARVGYVGAIAVDLNIRQRLTSILQRVRDICVDTYGPNMYPVFSVVDEYDDDTLINCFPVHLDYMLYEVLKNAASAAVQRALLLHYTNADGDSDNDVDGDGDGDVVIPPVDILICDCDEEVVVRIR